MKKIIRQNNAISPELLPKLHPLMARIYAARGITQLDDLERSLQHLLPFTSLQGIATAVDYLIAALEQQHSILIIGDYDADGATATAVAVTALRSFGAKHVSYLVPNRFTYGYGLTPEIVRVAARQQPHLLITVDNGISSIAGVAEAKALGMQVLITDHHLPGTALPAADAIVNPNQPGDLFPSKHLAGVGVIFYVMMALRSRLRAMGWFARHSLSEPNLADLLDLVALGTVADVVTLDKNNRILVHQGLQRIRAGKTRVGIQALLEVAGRSLSRLTASDLGFAVAPRLNAAGRLEDMSIGIACLLENNANAARARAVQLDALNRERQAIEADMQKEAHTVLTRLQQQRQLPLGICLFDPAWHQGVIGLLASRIKDEFHRPAIVFAAANEHEIKGSARSIIGVHMRDLLTEIAASHPELLEKFGGHAMAAGLSLSKEKFPLFKQIFEEAVQRYVTADYLEGKIYSDGALAESDFTVAIAEMLAQAGPWGQGFTEPLFDGVFYVREQRLVGERHLKLRLATTTSEELDAIAFQVDLAVWPNYRCDKVHVAYRLDINEFRGRRKLQLIIEHLAPCSSQ